MTTLPPLPTVFKASLAAPPATVFHTDEAGALSVYSGNVFREKDAKAIEVTAGSERDDADITIPLLGLHSVSGSVTALADGHTINWGTVVLLRADDKSEVRSFVIPRDPNEAQFNFRFVPDGEYILRVRDSRGRCRRITPRSRHGVYRLQTGASLRICRSTHQRPLRPEQCEHQRS
jgi:hypothetical protein